EIPLPYTLRSNLVQSHQMCNLGAGRLDLVAVHHVHDREAELFRNRHTNPAPPDSFLASPKPYMLTPQAGVPHSPVTRIVEARCSTRGTLWAQGVWPGPIGPAISDRTDGW